MGSNELVFVGVVGGGMPLNNGKAFKYQVEKRFSAIDV